MTVSLASNLNVVRDVAAGKLGLPPDAVHLAGVILDQLDYILPRLDAEAGIGSKTQNDVQIIVKDLNFAFTLLEQIGGPEEAQRFSTANGSAWDRLMAAIVAATKDLAGHKAQIQQMYAARLSHLADHRAHLADQQHVLDLGLPKAHPVAPAPTRAPATGHSGGATLILVVVFALVAMFFIFNSCTAPQHSPMTATTQETP